MLTSPRPDGREQHNRCEQGQDEVHHQAFQLVGQGHAGGERHDVQTVSQIQCQEHQTFEARQAVAGVKDRQAQRGDALSKSTKAAPIVPEAPITKALN